MSRYALIAIHEPALASMYASILEGHGLSTRVVSDGARAMEFIERRGTPLLAVVELSLPVFDGFELSAPAAELARRALPDARRIEPYDGSEVPAEDGAYDLAILSHVLEHVPVPGPLLAEAARVAHEVIVEVPLEDNRSARRPEKRAESTSW